MDERNLAPPSRGAASKGANRCIEALVQIGSEMVAMAVVMVLLNDVA